MRMASAVVVCLPSRLATVVVAGLGRCGSRSLASLLSPLYDNHVRMTKSHHKNRYAERKDVTETRCKGKKLETEKEKIR